jgi:hypothetical protein
MRVALVAALLFPLILFAQTENRSQNIAANMTRACYPAVGDVAITLEATTIADADSGALTIGSVYMIRCDTAAWVRFGSAAVTAAVDDWKIEVGEVFFIPTGGPESLAHVSVISVSVDGDCRLIECK